MLTPYPTRPRMSMRASRKWFSNNRNALQDKIELRHALYLQDPICPFCGCEMVLSNRIEPNQATLDHVVSRNQKSIYKMTEVELHLAILCCLECNNKRSRAEQADLMVRQNTTGAPLQIEEI